MSEDERDRVLEELHKAEDSLLAADEAAAKVPRARAARRTQVGMIWSPRLQYWYCLLVLRAQCRD